MNRKGCLIAAAVLVGLVAIAVVHAIGTYNRMTSLDESANNAWANVDTVLQRRYDLIPNLVATVKGYAAHEKGILEEVTRLRSQWGSAETAAARAQVAGQMEGALARLMLVAEQYPDLKANQNFMALQDELSGTENRVSVERRRFNEAIQVYNTTIRRFPARLYAGMFGFERRAPFEAAAEAREAPKVQF